MGGKIGFYHLGVSLEAQAILQIIKRPRIGDKCALNYLRSLEGL
jgi:hypothetical protein